MHRRLYFCLRIDMFQSAPDREVGRCQFAEPGVQSGIVFQSAPDREVGRCTTASTVTED